MDCKKKGYPTKGDAIFNHQRIAGGGKWFMAYQCPVCRQWHITTRGITRERLDEFARIIQDDSDNRKKFIERKTNKKTIYQINHQIGSFLVLYNKRQKTAEILQILL